MKEIVKKILLTFTIILCIILFIILLHKCIQNREGITTSSPGHITLVQEIGSREPTFDIMARDVDGNIATQFLEELDDLIQEFLQIKEDLSNYSLSIDKVSLGDTCTNTNCPLPIITFTGDPLKQTMNFILAKGPQGSIGPTGPIGPTGKTGVPGPIGIEGPVGYVHTL
jgi:hypothetical protein